MTKKNESEKKLTWVRISPTLSDETVTFCVDGCAGWKLREFIDYVLANQSSHCGTFSVLSMKEQVDIQRSAYSFALDIDYKDRKVCNQRHYASGFAVTGDARVICAQCNGGWGQMNYNVYVVQL